MKIHFKTHRARKHLEVCALGAGLSVAFLPYAVAAPAPSQQRVDNIQEVIVTAEKREENQQKIPISLAAFNDEKLEQLGIANIGDIGTKVPNFRTTAFPYSPSTIRLFMRGVGSNETQITQDPSVGVYVNGIYIARSAGLSMDLADLERVEVLRGPQGTLYGRNATGGAVNLITAKPTGEFSLKQDVSMGSRNFWRSKTQVNLPAVANVSTKIAYLQSETDGLVDNDGAGHDFGEDAKKGLLVALRWTPAETVTIDYTFDRAWLDYSANYYQATAGTQATTGDGYGSLAPNLGFLGGPSDVEVPLERHRVGSASLQNEFKGGNSDIEGHSLVAEWDLDGIVLKSFTGYRELHESNYQDFSANPTFTFFQNDPVNVDQHQFSQEFQAVGDAFDNKLRYVGGIYYFRESGSEFETDRADVMFTPTPVFGDGLVITERKTSATNSAAAIYGQGTYAITDALDLTLGARYTRDKREAEKEDIFFPAVASDSQTYSQFNPGAIVEYALDEDINLYGKVVTGYKSGGYNLRAGSVEDFERGFGKEKLTSYELGTKTQWLDNRVQLNVAIFRSDYEDIQVDIPVLNNPQLTNTFNAGEAEIDGAELELTVVPLEGLVLNATYGYLDADFTKVVDPQTGTDITDIYVLPNAPENTYAFDVEYTLPRFAFGVVTASANYSWQDDLYTQGNAVVARGATIDSYGLLGARITLSEIPLGPSTLKASVWGRNLENKEWVMDSIGSFRGFIADRLAAYGEPRTLGVDLSVQF
jgi:iron complex outermembrane recepter protein